MLFVGKIPAFHWWLIKWFHVFLAITLGFTFLLFPTVGCSGSSIFVIKIAHHIESSCLWKSETVQFAESLGVLHP